MPDVITVDKLVEVYSDGTKAVDGISFSVISALAIVTLGATLYLFRKVVK